MVDNPITRKEKYLAKLTGSYTGNIPDPITRVEKYLYDLCQKGISGLTPEEIENAVNKYLKENPVQPGATEEQAQQIKQNTDDVASLKEDISTKIAKFYASSQGETHLADSDSGKIMDMMLYGKSEQKQYSGDNIYYMDYEDYSQTYNGARITSTKFGYSVSGTISGAGGYTLTNRYITLAPGTYKMLLKNISALKIGLSKRDYSAIATISEGKTDTTFTLDEETEVCLTIRYSNTTSNETNEIMLTKNLEATSYEPYTGGIPSPNPDYPQEIKSVVNPTVKVCGKNLLNLNSYKENVKNGITITPIFNNEELQYLILNGTFKTAEWAVIWIGTLNPGTYTFSAQNSNVKVLRNWNEQNNTFTVTDENSVYRIVTNSSNMGESVKNVKIYPQLELGSTPTPYEPYHEQTVTLPYTLNAIPVSSGGNVTIDGQQYIADYVDVERGKLVRMVGEFVQNNQEWRTEKIALSYSVFSTKTPINNIQQNDDILNYCSNYFKCITTNKRYSENTLFINSGYFLIATMPSGTIIDDFLALVKGKLKVFYALATPIETDLTPEEIAAFKALATYYPITNISINSEQLDGYTVFNYPISMENGWNYVKQQIGDTRNYIYDMDARTQDTDLQAAEAYVNSEYAVALTELEV